MLGWPSIVGAAVALSVASARRSRMAAVMGCVLAAPMFAYLSLTPRFGWVALAAFVLLCVLAWRVRTASRIVIGVLALPAASLLLWLAYAVLNE